MSDTERFVRHPDALWRTTLRGVVVLPPGAEQPVLVTTPGDAAWGALDEPIALGALAAELAEAFGADVHAVTADVEPLLQHLVDIGAVVAA